MGLTNDAHDSVVGRIGPIIQVDRLKPKNSAGRDLPTAIGVALGLGALVILSIIVGPIAWYPLVSLAIGLAMWEVITRLRERSYIMPRTIMILGGQAIIWASWPLGPAGALGAFSALVLLIMFGRLFHHGRQRAPVNYLRDTAIAIFVLAWVPLFGAFAAMISGLSDLGVPGSLFIFTFMICVVASDTGGYVAGVMFGSRPMAPAISPKKSWEGFAGSMIAGLVAGVLCVVFLLGGHWWIGLILGAGMVLCATLGDLVESQFKREIGIKDMSGFLPGHGGVMDRLDGMLPSAAMTWLVLGVLAS
ncbi:phosphatidate cytidylyltransferase [Corynebacterium tapiri]|uniref:Phosphatidate cytidylyltransferase n=1 Tax=Corynebacterium tapiri TaxID=1448266 RepID=A0A5C4U5D1_9CORY|nr:phosphatidate cytidylyltransferase [Corynebacterium tapiri]TNL99288.1 phosphatidate cytidylyltransferase [Corynebacterium tapiri]